MANQTYTGTDRTTYVDKNDNKLMKMILPFIVGLALGWGANEMADAGNNKAGDDASRPAQTERR